MDREEILKRGQISSCAIAKLIAVTYHFRLLKTCEMKKSTDWPELACSTRLLMPASQLRGPRGADRAACERARVAISQCHRKSIDATYPAIGNGRLDCGDCEGCHAVSVEDSRPAQARPRSRKGAEIMSRPYGMMTPEEREEWADDHGYVRYRCPIHGVQWSDSGWCDYCAPEPDEPHDPRCECDACTERAEAEQDDYDEARIHDAEEY